MSSRQTTGRILYLLLVNGRPTQRLPRYTSPAPTIQATPTLARYVCRLGMRIEYVRKLYGTRPSAAQIRPAITRLRFFIHANASASNPQNQKIRAKFSGRISQKGECSEK